MEWICFFSGIFIGGLIGVFVMCIVQINSVNRLNSD